MSQQENSLARESHESRRFVWQTAVQCMKDSWQVMYIYSTLFMMCREFHSWVYDVDWKPSPERNDLHVVIWGGEWGWLLDTYHTAMTAALQPLEFQISNIWWLPRTSIKEHSHQRFGYTWVKWPKQQRWDYLNQLVTSHSKCTTVCGREDAWKPERLWKSVHYKLAPAMHSQFLMVTPVVDAFARASGCYDGVSFLSTSH